MEDFAKIFKDEKYGQVVVFCEENDDEQPVINIYFKPEGLGICKVGMNFTDDDDGYDKRDEAFLKITETEAVGAAKGIMDYLNGDGEDDE